MKKSIKILDFIFTLCIGALIYTTFFKPMQIPLNAEKFGNHTTIYSIVSFFYDFFMIYIALLISNILFRLDVLISVKFKELLD